MPVPEFVLALRSKIGHDPLPLHGATAIVFDAQGRLLLVRRSDNSQWALVTGCLEPGEQPAAGAAREVCEETGVSATVERLVSVEALDLSVAANGDQVYWLNVVFCCSATDGAARVNDDESIQVAWFELDGLPQLPEHHTRYLTHALAEDQAALVRQTRRGTHVPVAGTPDGHHRAPSSGAWYSHPYSQSLPAKADAVRQRRTA